MHGLKGRTQIVIPNKSSNLDSTEFSTFGLMDIDNDMINKHPYLVNLEKCFYKFKKVFFLFLIFFYYNHIYQGYS